MIGAHYYDAYVAELEHALADLTDGCGEWREIQAHTGLTEERCKEIERIAAKTRSKCYRS